MDDIFDHWNGKKVSFFDDLSNEILISKSTEKTLYFEKIFVACGSVPTEH